MFSHAAVVGQWEGAPALLVRMANARNNQVVDARVTMHLLMDVPTADGSTMRRFHDMKLVRDRTPVFALTWTAVHPLDAESPLHGFGPEDLERLHGQLFMTIIGTDESFMAEIHARRIFDPGDVAWNARFCDVLTRAPEGHLRLDFTRFHDIEPLEPLE
jgi:inward rectifier potassium channel